MTETYERPDTDIHLWFSLSYCNYLVLHRSILQSMPTEWQHRFTAIMDELHDAMGPEMQERMPTRYDIRCLAREGEWVHPDCENCEGKGHVPATSGAVYANTGLPVEHDDCPECEGSGKDYDGEQRPETPEEIGFVDDPIPHYNRGRTVIDFETGEEARWCRRCEGHHRFSKPCPDAAAETTLPDPA